MSSASGGPSNRRGQYTSRACNECRRRRCKCDGARPACGSCSSYGHQCSWGNESDAHRPPTKQFVETLRVKVQVLESELARLQAINQEQGGQKTEPETPGSDNVSTGEIRFPSQSRSTVPGTALAHGEHAQRSPWLVYLDEHSRNIPTPPPGTIYQFIFNINPSLPHNEQPQAAYHSLLCDWNRHLPLLDGIQFTRLEHDTLLDRCFKYSSCWLMSIVPRFFLHDMLRALYAHESPEVENYSPLLHCSLLAHATAFSDDPFIKQPQIRNQFAERAKQLLHDEIGQLNLCLVQALLFLSEYHCGLGESERGYMYLGMSIRAIRALEFGKPEPRWSGRATPAEISYWCFWSIYSHDKIMSLEMNVDCDLRSKDYFALDLPRVDREMDRLSWTDTAPVGHDSHIWLTQVFAESCRLMLISEAIIRFHRSNTLAPPPLEDNRAAEINWRLDAWLSELPTELLISDSNSPILLPHIIMVNMMYWWLVLWLHQPYYRPPLDRNAPPVDTSRPFGDLSDALCDRAACKIILLVDLYDRRHGLRFFPRQMIQAIQVAGALLVKQQTIGAGQHETQGVIRECVAALRTIAETWQCAEKYANFLQNLLSEYIPHSPTSSYPTSTNTPQSSRTHTEQPRSVASDDTMMEYMPEASRSSYNNTPQ